MKNTIAEEVGNLALKVRQVQFLEEFSFKKILRHSLPSLSLKPFYDYSDTP